MALFETRDPKQYGQTLVAGTLGRGAMTSQASRLERKLTDIGIDLSSRSAKENFCLVREFLATIQGLVDSFRERRGHPS